MALRYYSTMDNDGEREREDVNVIGGASNQSNPEARHCVMEQEQASKRRLTLSNIMRFEGVR